MDNGLPRFRASQECISHKAGYYHDFLRTVFASEVYHHPISMPTDSAFDVNPLFTIPLLDTSGIIDSVIKLVAGYSPPLSLDCDHL